MLLNLGFEHTPKVTFYFIWGDFCAHFASKTLPEGEAEKSETKKCSGGAAGKPAGWFLANF